MTRWDDPPPNRFLSHTECAALAARVIRAASSGGSTELSLESSWTGNIRWGRNVVHTSGDVRDNDVTVVRVIRGVPSYATVSEIDDTSLAAAVWRTERMQQLWFEDPDADRPQAIPPEVPSAPKIWSDATYTLDAGKRAAAVRNSVAPALAAGMLAAGYVQVSGRGRAVMNNTGRDFYYPFTTAQCSITVRNPEGTASGWAGVDWSDWRQIDPHALASVALDKCLRSRNPIRIEPGRYTVVLEPQAVCDLVSTMVTAQATDRREAEGNGSAYTLRRGETKIGHKVIDERLSITADPMDPVLGFVPFDRGGNVYQPTTWFERGVLKTLSYDRMYAIQAMGLGSPLPNSGAFHMTGGTATIDEMVSSTKRGFLVTRFSDVKVQDKASLMCTGYTRDGLWFIENGAIKAPAVNFRFMMSPLFVLNNIRALGVPQRVFRPEAPTVVPAIKADDFNFTSVTDAV